MPFPCRPALLSLILTLPATSQIFDRDKHDSVPAEVSHVYNKGLRFLLKSQQPDGSWRDRSGSLPGVSGFAIMAILAHGEDPNHGPHATHLKKGIAFILSKQDPKTGLIGNTMYNHGFATLALTECYGMLDEPRLGPALKKAVKLILESQKKNPNKAWRYNPDSRDADTTVTGCQLVALYSARNAGIPVPNSAFKSAQRYMLNCRNTSKFYYGYNSRNHGTQGQSSATLTSIGSLCLALGKQKNTKNYQQTSTFLKSKLSYLSNRHPYYFRYYMSQALFHADEATWQDWNSRNLRLLSVSQKPDGSWSGPHGPTFSTAAALLSLALNYRFLPIYER